MTPSATQIPPRDARSVKTPGPAWRARASRMRAACAGVMIPSAIHSCSSRSRTCAPNPIIGPAAVSWLDHTVRLLDFGRAHGRCRDVEDGIEGIAHLAVVIVVIPLAVFRRAECQKHRPARARTGVPGRSVRDEGVDQNQIL